MALYREIVKHEHVSLSSSEETINATAHRDILYNYVLHPFLKHFGEGPLMGVMVMCPQICNTYIYLDAYEYDPFSRTHPKR